MFTNSIWVEQGARMDVDEDGSDYEILDREKSISDKRFIEILNEIQTVDVSSVILPEVYVDSDFEVTCD